MTTRNKYIVGAILFALGAGVLLFVMLSKPHMVTVPTQQVDGIISADVSHIQTIGYSVEGRPIDSYTFGSGKQNIVFIGGIHGGYEWNSVLLAYQIIDYFDKNASVIPENVTLIIIPSMNPDGVHKVVGVEGRFDVKGVSTDDKILASGRFNANGVDLNRNFDCKWQPNSKWRDKTVSAGSAVFSEPEAKAVKTFFEKINPFLVVFWHSQANGVFGASCGGDVLPKAYELMQVYSSASGYPASKTFGSYEVTGDAGDWLSSIGISAFEVELKTHTTIELKENIAGVKAVIDYAGNKK